MADREQRAPRREVIVTLAMRDRLNDLRHFVECAWMAAGDLPREEANAIQVVLDHAIRGMARLGKDMAGEAADEAEEGEENAND